MSIGESDRFHLYEVAREKWGDEAAAATLMNALPPDGEQLATRADIDELRSELKGDIGELRSELYLRISEQTRTLLLAVAGLNLSAVGLAFAAVRLA